MADNRDITMTTFQEGGGAIEEPSTLKKQRAAQNQDTAATTGRTPSPADSLGVPRGRKRKLDRHERLDKLREIELQVRDGASSRKEAIRKAGISEQTYYNWKRHEKQIGQFEGAPVSGDDGLADLVQLEEENRHLRTILAEKLRAENAELRRRLGLD